MPVRLIFAEQATGVVTLASGDRSLGKPPYIRCDSMAEALDEAKRYLQLHEDHEAWIGSAQTSYRITLPAQGGFVPWIDAYRIQGILEPVRAGLSLGEVISILGFPNQCSVLRSKSPLAVIFRYLPGPIDFHF